MCLRVSVYVLACVCVWCKGDERVHVCVVPVCMYVCVPVRVILVCMCVRVHVCMCVCERGVRGHVQAQLAPTS